MKYLRRLYFFWKYTRHDQYVSEGWRLERRRR
jgi:hypothetical protein